jgi:hypothetical protein
MLCGCFLLSLVCLNLRGSYDMGRFPLILQVFLLLGRELLKVAMGTLLCLLCLLCLLRQALRLVVRVFGHGALQLIV